MFFLFSSLSLFVVHAFLTNAVDTLDTAVSRLYTGNYVERRVRRVTSLPREESLPIAKICNLLCHVFDDGMEV